MRGAVQCQYADMACNMTQLLSHSKKEVVKYEL